VNAKALQTEDVISSMNAVMLFISWTVLIASAAYRWYVLCVLLFLFVVELLAADIC